MLVTTGAAVDFLPDRRLSLLPCLAFLVLGVLHGVCAARPIIPARHPTRLALFGPL